MGVAHLATESTKDFYAGLSTSLAAMLSSPKFLFRQIAVVQDKSGQWRMEAHAKAQQLSFFLWNAGPDLELLAAAERGDLDTKKGLTILPSPPAVPERRFLQLVPPKPPAATSLTSRTGASVRATISAQDVETRSGRTPSTVGLPVTRTAKAPWTALTTALHSSGSSRSSASRQRKNIRTLGPSCSRRGTP